LAASRSSSWRWPLRVCRRGAGVLVVAEGREVAVMPLPGVSG